MRVPVFHATVRDGDDVVRLLAGDDVARRRGCRITDPRHRDAHLTGQVLLQVVVAPLVGLAPGRLVLDRTCRRCGGPHGKPRVPGADLDLSLTYAGGTVLLAVSPRHRPLVGLDAEPRRPPPGLAADPAGDGTLAREVLGPTEHREWLALPAGARSTALVRWWTRKEAVLKALGHGLSVPPRALRVSPPGGPPRLLAWDADLAGADLADPVALADVDLPTVAGTLAAVGVTTVEPDLQDADPRLSAASLTRW
ncbi:4'-phosphopantetheinyl transferase family protein [Ornithinimicrobium sp. W1679]|uniref:4'-phosphopantetheinyl transferase family protein n=1 Tax=unclassified Ornithinimicrobium TaxID=2615080 RepID=UPI003CEF1EDD